MFIDQGWILKASFRFLSFSVYLPPLSLSPSLSIFLFLPPQAFMQFHTLLSPICAFLHRAVEAR